MYDALVVGARCAGAPTAMLLARRGYRTLLLDRAIFPSDTISTHIIQMPGVAQLQRWGLLDAVLASNAPRIHRFTLDVGPFALHGTPPPAGDTWFDLAPRRTVLDKILIDAAVAAGAELRQGFTVTELVWDGGRVVGVRGHTAGGPTVTEQARIVIGADGQQSVVARAVAAPRYDEHPVLTCIYYAYWSDVPVDGMEIYLRPHRAIVAFPTNEALTGIAVQWPRALLPAVRGDVPGHYHDALALAPALAERVRGGQQAERFLGRADLPNFFRKPYGPGWALLGDAGYNRDPITAQGMTDAFRDAELLVDALDAGLGGRRPPADALAGYERARNAAADPLYALTYRLACLEPPLPKMQALLGPLRDNPEQTNRLFGALTGTVPVSAFFAPETTGAMVAGAAGARGGDG